MHVSGDTCSQAASFSPICVSLRFNSLQLSLQIVKFLNFLYLTSDQSLASSQGLPAHTEGPTVPTRTRTFKSGGRGGVLLDGFDPLLLLLRRGCRYSVNHVVALDDAPICLRLAGFDDLAFVVGVVKLKAVLDRGQRAGHGHGTWTRHRVRSLACVA